jgi:16S rRNA (cytosine967-C5)-methyltransferase
MNLKSAAAEIIEAIDEGKYSNLALNECFVKQKFSYKEKGFITEIIYGYIRNKILVDYIIDKFTQKGIKKKIIKNIVRISVYQMLFMNSDKAGIIWEAVEVSKKKYKGIFSGFVNGLLRNIERNISTIYSELEEQKRYDILYSVPKWFEEIVKDEYGDKTVEVLKNLKKSPILSIRVNKLKYSNSEFEEYVAKNGGKVLFNFETIYYVENIDIINSDIFKKGFVFAQDGSSYLAAKLMEAEEGETILDCCAAPGSKSCVIAEEMNGKGEVVALDIFEHRLNLIKENSIKEGVTNIRTELLDARETHKLGIKFDRVLVDAPCSGLGIIRKKPEIIYEKSGAIIAELVKLQTEIVESAAESLKSGGILIYSTCTFTKAENFNLILNFLESHKEFETVEIKESDIPKGVIYRKDSLNGINIECTNEFLDGFYIIKLKKAK